MTMKLLQRMLTAVLLAASFTGCGSSSTPADTVITGTASKGIIANGTVNVYALDAAGTKGALLAGPLSTDSNGRYRASLGVYAGSLLVEASGTYTDEATGQQVTIDAAKPLHSLVDAVDNSGGNNRVVAITPLTELAWRKASANGTVATPATAIKNANQLVSDLFKIRDIVGTEPVRPDATAMTAASQEAQAYTLALAALSNMAKPASGPATFTRMDDVLTAMTTEVEHAETAGTMGSSAVSGFETALSDVPLAAGYSSAAGQLSGMGRKTQVLTLATSGTLPSGVKIYAVQGTILLPVDSATNLPMVSLRADSTGQTLSDVFLPGGSATGMANMTPIAHYQPLKRQVQFSIVFDQTRPGIDTGTFATLAYDVAPGFVVSAADFTVVPGDVAVKDSNGATIAGVTVELR